MGTSHNGPKEGWLNHRSLISSSETSVPLPWHLLGLRSHIDIWVVPKPGALTHPWHYICGANSQCAAAWRNCLSRVKISLSNCKLQVQWMAKSIIQIKDSPHKKSVMHALPWCFFIASMSLNTVLQKKFCHWWLRCHGDHVTALLCFMSSTFLDIFDQSFHLSLNHLSLLNKLTVGAAKRGHKLKTSEQSKLLKIQGLHSRRVR